MEMQRFQSSPNIIDHSGFVIDAFDIVCITKKG